eukprot:Sspe_Gene.21486::Locus_8074_Transcript_1_1_Confidence_1.000_Length_3770::g.21486::m.21486
MGCFMSHAYDDKEEQAKQNVPARRARRRQESFISPITMMEEGDPPKRPKRRKARKGTFATQPRKSIDTSAADHRVCRVAMSHIPSRDQSVDLPGTATDEVEKLHGITLLERDLVRHSFGKMAPTIDTAATFLYKRLFQLAPHLETRFRSDVEIQSLSMMRAWDTILRVINDLPALTSYLCTLARRHVDYGVSVDDYPIMGQALVDTLRATLMKEFSEEEAAAWTKVYGMVSGIMAAEHKNISSPTALCERRWSLEDISQRHKDLALESWSRLPSVGSLGQIFYRTLFSNHPEVKPLFNETMMEVQANHFVSVMASVVQALHNPEGFQAQLEEIASRHISYGVEPEHYDMVKPAIMEAIRSLGRGTTEEHVAAWEVVFKVMGSILKEAHNKVLADRVLPEKKRRMVQESWGEVQNREEFGNIFYKSLFAASPQLKDLFANVHEQGGLFVRTIQRIIHLLDHINSLERLLQELVEVHLRHNIDEQQYSMVAQTFMTTMREVLGEQTWATVKTAWRDMWDFILHSIHVIHTEKLNKDGILTMQQMDIIRASWAKIPDVNNLASTLYKCLFAIDRSLRRLFSRVDLLRQGERLMGVLRDVVDSLNDLSRVTPSLQQLAERHVNYGVEIDHYDTLGKALLDALQEDLAKSFGEKELRAWSVLFAIIKKIMVARHRMITMPMSDQERHLVKSTWEQVDQRDYPRQLFKTLFSDNPPIERMFSRANMARQHTRFMDTMSLIIANLHEVKEIRPLFNELVVLHQTHNVTKVHFEAFGGALLKTLPDALPSGCFKQEHREAWEHFYELVVELMTTHCTAQPVEQRELRIQDIQLVQDTWARVSDQDVLGANFYQRLFAEAPNVKSLFTRTDMSAQHHEIVAVLDRAVNNLKNIDGLTPVLKEVGETHVQYGAEVAHFALVEGLLIDTVEASVGPYFSSEHREAWENVLDVVMDIVTSGFINKKWGNLAPTQHPLIRLTWDLVKNNAKLGDLVTELLLAKNPKLRDTLKGSVSRIGRLVVQMVGETVQAIGSLRRVVPRLQEIGRHHFEYNVADSSYRDMTAAVILALKKIIGSRFTRNYQAAWEGLLTFMSSVMIDSQRERAKEVNQAFYTTDEVKLHASRKDCWIIVRDKEDKKKKVYDVTKWLGSHPGGASVILKWAGTDATKEFYRIHSQAAVLQLPQWYIGLLRDEKDQNPAMSISGNSASSKPSQSSSTDRK